MQKHILVYTHASKTLQVWCRVRKPLFLIAWQLRNCALAFETSTRVLPSSFVHEHLEHDSYILMSDLLRLKGGVGGTFMDLDGYAICDTRGVAMDHTDYSNLPTATLLSISFAVWIELSNRLGNSQQWHSHWEPKCNIVCGALS